MSMNHIKDGNSYDVVVIGGGPAGATVATLLTRGGLRVAVFEREHFPRFHVGESLLPANLPIFDRLGCHGFHLLAHAGLPSRMPHYLDRCQHASCRLPSRSTSDGPPPGCADRNGNGSYDSGEGLPGVTVTPSQGRYYAITSSSGGFVIPSPAIGGAIALTADGGGLQSPVRRKLTLTANNVKMDFVLP